MAGNVYGDLYQSTLINRSIEDAGLTTNGAAVINWKDLNTDVTLKV